MRSDREMDDPAAFVCQYQKHVQDLEPDRRHNEEIYRDHSLYVILEERSPGL